MKFIITQSEETASLLIKFGYEPLPDKGSGFFIFKNTPGLMNFCLDNLKDEAYIFTDKLFF